MKWRVYCWFMLVAGVLETYAQPLFQRVPEARSGIRFTNTIEENDSLHIFRYEYLYNGHGVALGDFNKDGLDDVFISGNVVPNKLYLNKGGLTFEDITEKAGVKGNGFWRTGVTVADVNGDGWEDIYVCHSGPKEGRARSNELFIHQGLRNGIPVFKEMATDYGLDAPGTLSTQAAFFDYDRDGDLDMFLVNHSNHTVNPYVNTAKIRSVPDMRFGNRLFRQDKAADGNIRFTDVTLKAGIINNALNFGLSVVVSDLNRDGWPDLYTSSDYTEQDYCYLNNKNGTFRQVLQQSFTHISKYSMGADIADINNDGWPDVFTLDMLPEDNFRQKLLKGPDEYDAYNMLIDSGYFHQQMRNMLHLHRGIDANGNIRFSEIGQLAGISRTDWSWSALFGDLDNDGHKDLLVTNGYLRDFTDNDFLKYTVADEQLAQAAKGNLNFKTYELVRKMPSNKLRNYLFRNDGSLHFSDSTEAWGLTERTISNAAVQADFDNDGDLDLLIGNNNEPVYLYENRLNQQPVKNNWIQFRLIQKGSNPFAIGAKITLYSKNGIQWQEVFPVRGYQSTGSRTIHIGLYDERVDSVWIEWPDGNRQRVLSPEVNKSHFITYATQLPETSVLKKSTDLFFREIPDHAGLDFRHRENDFVDFKVEVLMPYQLSRMGPALAKADVNQDGYEDVFVGGALGQSGKLFLQQADGRFKPASSQPWEADSASEDVRAIFIDVDTDGDEDLYVVSGGNEYEEGIPEFADRLYLNDGRGGYSKSADALPQEMLGSKLAICKGDIDADGDLDLFIGGAAIPGRFPYPSRSYLLRNDSKDGKVRFTDVTKEWNPELLYPGIIHSAVFSDMNGDGRPDLLLAGEWMTIRFFQHLGKSFHEVSELAGFTQPGLWSAITVLDINKDGKPDIVAGNAGENLPFHASEKEPVSITSVDLDGNGQEEGIFSYFIQGTSYPAASRDELLDQVVPFRKKFVKYRQYASVTTDQLIPPQTYEDAPRWELHTLSSVVYINEGDGAFRMEVLPKEAQFSRVFSIVPLGDTLLLAGNFFPWRVQWGRSDASPGTALVFDKEGKARVLDNAALGLFLDGDIRQVLPIHGADGKQKLLIAPNNGPLKLLETKR